MSNDALSHTDAKMDVVVGAVYGKATRLDNQEQPRTQDTVEPADDACATQSLHPSRLSQVVPVPSQASRNPLRAASRRRGT